MNTRPIVTLALWTLLCFGVCDRAFGQGDPFGGDSPRVQSGDAEKEAEVNEHHVRIKDSYARLPKILAQISPQSEFALYEGLPRRNLPQDGNKFFSELVGKECQIRGREFFYKRHLNVVPADAKELRELILGSNMFQRWRGLKMCGGFHADFCLTWTNDGQAIDFLICFGCEEVKVYSGDTWVHCDLSHTGVQASKNLLLKYREHALKK